MRFSDKPVLDKPGVTVCAYVQEYICTYVQEYVCTRIHMYVCTRVRMYVCTRVHMYVCTRVRTYVCTRVRMYVCTRVRMYVCTRVRMYVCTRVRMYDVQPHLIDLTLVQLKTSFIQHCCEPPPLSCEPSSPVYPTPGLPESLYREQMCSGGRGPTHCNRFVVRNSTSLCCDEMLLPQTTEHSKKSKKKSKVHKWEGAGVSQCVC